MLERIVNGVVFEGKPSSTDFDLRITRLANGHVEAVIQPQIVWTDFCLYEPSPDAKPLTERELADEAARRAEQNRIRAARRARKAVRQKVKQAGFDELLTLTYKQNQTDEKLCKYHFRVFIERLRECIPGFAYVAAFERQERGAWHVHVACHRMPVDWRHHGVKLKMHRIIRSIWQRVTKDAGNIDLGSYRRRYHKQQSSIKLAAYIAKYFSKDMGDIDDGRKYAKRWTSSLIDVPKPVLMRFFGTSMGELVELVWSEFAPWGSCPAEFRLMPHKYGDFYYIDMRDDSLCLA